MTVRAASAVRITTPVSVGALIGVFLSLTLNIIRDPLTNLQVDFRNRVTYSDIVRRKKIPPDIRAYFAEMGRQGGVLGGKARAQKMTAEERSESARRAVQARWAKAKKSEQ